MNLRAAPGTREGVRSLVFRTSFVLVAASLAAACIVQRGRGDPSVGGANDYVGAGVLAATGIGASVVHRKITGGCYAACPPGTVCDRDSGLCERRACACPADQVCEVVGGEVVCTQPPRRHESDLDASRDGAAVDAANATDATDAADAADAGA
jgi:hypothetical protein